MNQKNPLIRVENLTKHFPVTRGIIFQKQVGAVQAVDGLTFDIHQGETFGMVGESGCGKSTTGRAILQLHKPTALPQVPHQGTAHTQLGTRGGTALAKAQEDGTA